MRDIFDENKKYGKIKEKITERVQRTKNMKRGQAKLEGKKEEEEKEETFPEIDFD